VPSLLTYRRSIAVELGPFVATTTTTGASDLVSFTCASLVNANACGAQFQSCWAYSNATSGALLAAQRQVLNQGGYDPDAGSVTVARAFSTSVTSGMGFEILSKLPAITDDLGTIGIREIVNDTLLTMPPIDMLPMTGVTAKQAYDVTTTYSWLTDKAQILGIYVQNSGDDYPKQTGYSWDWLYDANAPRLLLPNAPFVTGDTFYIKAHRPAQSWIQTAGTWGEDSDGLQNDTDAALPLLQVVRAQALSTCYRMLGSRQGPDEYRSFYREREGFWSTKAYALRWWMDQRGDEDNEPRVKMVFYSKPYGSSKAYR
jgi:hypothetical protein